MQVPRSPFDSTPESVHDCTTRRVEDEDKYGDWVREWDEHVRCSQFPDDEDELQVDAIAGSTGELARGAISVESDVQSFIEMINTRAEFNSVHDVLQLFESIQINVFPFIVAVANYNCMLRAINGSMTMEEVRSVCLLTLMRIAEGCLFELGDEGTGVKYDDLNPFIVGCLKHLRDEKRDDYIYDERTIDKLQFIVFCAKAQMNGEDAETLYHEIMTMGLLQES